MNEMLDELIIIGKRQRKMLEEMDEVRHDIRRMLATLERVGVVIIANDEFKAFDKNRYSQIITETIDK